MVDTVDTLTKDPDALRHSDGAEPDFEMFDLDKMVREEMLMEEILNEIQEPQ